MIGAEADSAIERLERLGHVGHIQERRSGVQHRRVVAAGLRPPLEVTQAGPEHVVGDPGHRTARPPCEIRQTSRDVIVQVQRRAQGDSYDNALAETIIGLYKTELIRRRGPWKGLDDVEYATLEWVDWFNHRRLLEPIGYVPPAEFEAAYWSREGSEKDARLRDPSLR
jgi:hypothetical protein